MFSILDDITPVVLTYNEAPNIGRTLEKLRWAAEIIVVDSFSTDETLDIVKTYPQARILQRKFDSFAGQCNYALGHVRTLWVLSLDADYCLSEGFMGEVAALQSDEAASGYRAAFRYCIHGWPLRGSLYPPRTVLYRRERARYRDEGHGHRVQINGSVQMLRSKILHDDRKSLDRWLSEQNRYMVREAAELLATPMNALKLQDQLRRCIIVAPVLIFFYTLVRKGLIFNGWPGWYYVFQRTIAELILSVRLIEQRLLLKGGNDQPCR